MKICVYGAASVSIDGQYILSGEKLGEEMAKRGHTLVFGGGSTGLMGAVARGIDKENGKIIGVIPKFFIDYDVEIAYNASDEMIVTETMRERKQIMEDKADGFIITPGGIGTFEEFFEILTLKQLGRHNKPIAIFNDMGYYDELLAMMKASVKKDFMKDYVLDIFKVFDDVDDMLDYIENYSEPPRTIKQLKG